MRRTIENIIKLELLQKHLSMAQEICHGMYFDTQDEDEIMTAYEFNIGDIIGFAVECANKERSKLPELRAGE